MKAVGHFGEHFGWKGTNSSNPRWCAKTKAVSYGVAILTDDYFVLSQYMHLTNRQTDSIAIAILCIALHAVAR